MSLSGTHTNASASGMGNVAVHIARHGLLASPSGDRYDMRRVCHPRTGSDAAAGRRQTHHGTERSLGSGRGKAHSTAE